MSRIVRLMRRVAGAVAVRCCPVWWKEFHELSYWKDRKEAEGTLSNRHYKYFYTTHFGLDETFYQDKVIVDIGCGPRGSLEWASMASRRIGVDPLADEYLRLGAGRHRMEYICAPAETIPLRDGECDVAFSFNSLDHVEDVERTLNEIKRIVRPGGMFLLLVEINHPPTACEPHLLTPERVTDGLKPEFECGKLQVYRPVNGGMYRSIEADDRIVPAENTREPGYLSAQFTRGTPD